MTGANSTWSSASPSESDSGWLRLEATIDKFEQAWQQPNPPRIADFLPPAESPERLALLQELVKVDLEYRWKNGQQALIEDYVREFPELTANHSAPPSTELILEEVRVRQYHGTTPTQRELADRFPGVVLELPRGAPKSAEPSTSWGPQDRNPRNSTVPARQSGPASGRFSSAPDSEGSAPLGRLNQYELREQIGRGGFATVYRAYDVDLHREVAIKIPRAELMDDAGGAGRMMREAQSAASLRHPAIVPIYEVGRHGDQAYIVYEYVPGQTLSALLRETRPAPEQAASWLATVAEALHYAHHCGIVHRDVKPANIIMATPGHATGTGFGVTPMLADFGLALQAGVGVTVTQQGDILGTPAYMPPEQAAGLSHDVDARSDVYSLGVILYEMLSGQLPFQGSSASVLHKVIHEDPSPPGRFRRDIPADLETICLKAMAKEPHHRYHTAGEFAEDLRRFLEHKPVRARRRSMFGRLLLWARRKPALAATILIATVVSLSVATVSFWRVVQERDRFRAERDRAEANLLRALFSDANAQLRARDTGWWWTAMSRIRLAARLDASRGNRAELRDLAIQCMGTEYPCMRLQHELEGHREAVLCVAASHDGKLIASGSRDKTIRLWEMPSGKCLAVLTGPEQVVSCVAFDPEGRFLAAGWGNGAVTVWELEGVGTHFRKDNSPVDVSPERKSQRSSLPEKDSRPRSFDMGPGVVRGMAFSPKGNWLAVGCMDGNIQLLPMDSGENPRTFVGHTDHVLALKFFSDGNVMASSSSDLSIRLWDVATGQCRETWNIRNAPNTLAVGDGDHHVAWGEFQAFGITLRHRGDSVMRSHAQIHTGAVTHVQFGQKGRLLTASEDGTLKLGMQSSNGYRELAIARGSYGSILSAALGPKDEWVAAAYLDGKVRVWELAEPPQRLLATHNFQRAVALGNTRKIIDGHTLFDCSKSMAVSPERLTPPPVSALAVSADNTALAYAAWSGKVRVWSLESRQQLMAWEAHSQLVRCIAASPTSAQFVTASADGLVKLWNWSDPKLVRTWSPGLGELFDVTWSQDGRWIAACGLRGVSLWNSQTEEMPRRISDISGFAGRVTCSNRFLAATEPSGTMKVWDLESGELRFTLAHRAAINDFEFSHDGTRLASISVDHTTRIWDMNQGKELEQFPFDGLTPEWLSWHRDGKHILTGGRYPTQPFIWDVRTGARTGLPMPRFADQGQFLPNGKGFLWGTDFGNVRLFDFALPSGDMNSDPRAETDDVSPNIELGPIIVPGGHWDRMWGLAASADGRIFATAAHDQTVKLWNVETRELLRTLEGHTEIVWSVAFSPDSKLLASTSSNDERKVGEIKIWEVATGRELAHLEGHSKLVTAVEFHASGKWCAFGKAAISLKSASEIDGARDQSQASCSW